jgi:hypothetical protein
MRILACGTLLGTLLLGACAGAPREPAPAIARDPASEDDSFTIVALPDTQYYSQRLPAAFESQTRWIIEHAKDNNIRLVIGLGDIVDDGSDLAQWKNAMAALEPLRQNRIPYFLAIGNHDYSPPYVDARPRARAAGNFNRNVGPLFYAGEATYGEPMVKGANENFYGTIRAAGRNYLVLILEVSPRDTTLEWAAKVIEAHPDDDVIVAMHSYMYTDNNRVTVCAAYNKRYYGLERDNDGEEVWSKLLSKYPNVRLVLSGHIPVGGVGRRYDVGQSGNLVNQVLSDYQNEPNAGNGWLRMMTVRPSMNRIDVRTFSPYLAEHPELRTAPSKTDPSDLFSLDYGNYGIGRATGGTVRGIVRSARSEDLCHGIPGATVRFPGGATVTDAQGMFTARIAAEELDPHAAYQAVNLTVEKKGWATSTRRATVHEGDTSVEQVLLEPAGAAPPPRPEPPRPAPPHPAPPRPSAAPSPAVEPSTVPSPSVRPEPRP